MSARLALAVSAVLGVLVLIPVVAVVALGLYGSSLGGTVEAKSAAGALLKIVPAHGVPGTTLKVQGDDWPPRVFVSVYVSRPVGEGKPAAARLRLAEVLTSRRGGFEFETLVPRSLIPKGAEKLLIEAEQAPTKDGAPTKLIATWGVDPYPNTLSIKVIDAGNGLAAPGAQLRIEDGFGQEVAAGVTGEDGVARFAGLRPGESTLKVKRIDYSTVGAALAIADAGHSELTVGLKRDAGKRLYLSGAVTAADGKVKLIGVDRASGLRVEEFIQPPASRRAPLSGGRTAIYQGYLIPVNLGDRMSDGAASLQSFWAMGDTGWRMFNQGGVQAGSIWHSYIGRSVRGDVIFSRSSSPIFDPGAHLYVVDPVSGTVLVRKVIDRNTITPILSEDGRRVIFINWVSGFLEMLDVVTGEKVEQYWNVPYLTIQALLDPSTENSVLLYAAEGAVYRMDLTTGILSAPILQVRGAAWLASSGDGRVMVAAGVLPQLMLTDPKTGGIDGIVPLETPADWSWRDPDGPFIFTVTFSGTNLITVQLIDAASFKQVGSVEFPIFPS